jgi:hypothetical protein
VWVSVGVQLVQACVCGCGCGLGVDVDVGVYRGIERRVSAEGVGTGVACICYMLRQFCNCVYN